MLDPNNENKKERVVSQMSEEEKKEFLESLGLKEKGLDKIFDKLFKRK